MGKVFGALRPCLSPYRDERQMNLSYMVFLDMWNMFGQKFLSFIGGYIFQKNMSGYSIWVFIPTGLYSVPLFQRDRELPILDPVACVIAFKLHGEGIRHSQALSTALQGWALDESFLYGPSRHVEHVWAKIPQFHRRLVGWAGGTEPPAHNKSMRT